MPWSGPRNSVPERKPSLVQCQNVQNQTYETVLTVVRDSSTSSRGTQEEAERHPIGYAKLFPAADELLRELDIEPVLVLHRACGEREQHGAARGLGNEGHVERR